MQGVLVKCARGESEQVLPQSALYQGGFLRNISRLAQMLTLILIWTGMELVTNIKYEDPYTQICGTFCGRML